MAKTAGAQVEYVEAAAFRAYPQAAVVVLGHAAHDVARQSAVGQRGAVMLEDLVRRIHIVDAAEVGANPQGALSVLGDAPHALVGDAARRGVGPVDGLRAAVPVVAHESVGRTHPHHAVVVLAEGAEEVGSETVGQSVPLGAPVGVNLVTAVGPRAYPQCLCAVFVERADASFGDGMGQAPALQAECAETGGAYP